ncbi:hypothetical protein IFM89_012010 [Coptis chinensis]|uniref:S-protein homolog n=1 Tax=Coptis chinensis TaxID=261450 RepID=A0A835IWJ1_9MAGN|nr:hypothetical protein IFM89_012010 [Coptis chinensis]
MGFGFSSNKIHGSKLTQLLLVAVMFLLWECSSVSGQRWISQIKTTVSVWNQLSENSTQHTGLYLHCKSADDDLGPHVLGVGQEFKWKFYVNIWETTLFWCYMAWIDTDGRQVQGSFDVYKAKRDYRKSGYHYCPRYVKRRGIYGNGPEPMFTWAPKE